MAFDSWGLAWGNPSAWGSAWVHSGATPAPVVPDSSGGYRPTTGPRRTKQELRRQRQELGILPAEVAAIEDVAARQVDRLEQDRQKQYDELAGELALRKLEMRAGMMEALALERERLMGVEIAARMQEQVILQRNENEIMLLTLIAAAAAL